jgi:hypothetical protein
MSDRAFARKYEKPLHVFIFGWSFIGALVALITDNLNSVPGGDTCFISSSPVKCEIDPLVECQRGKHSATYAMVISYVPNIFSFLGISVCMARIACKVHHMGRLSSIFHRRGLAQSTGGLFSPNDFGNTAVSTQEETKKSFFKVFVSAVYNRFVTLPAIASSNEGEEVRNEIVTRSEAIARARIRDTYQQAILYVLSFFLVYLWPYIFGIHQLVGGRELPFAVAMLFYIFYPLGGFFNILVYTRLKVAIVKRRNPEFIWIRCFWEVIKAGGDAPPRRQSRVANVALRRRGTGSSSSRPNRHGRRRANMDQVSRSSRPTVRRGTVRRVDGRINSDESLISPQISAQVDSGSSNPYVSEVSGVSDKKYNSSGLQTCTSEAVSTHRILQDSNIDLSFEPRNSSQDLKSSHDLCNISSLNENVIDEFVTSYVSEAGEEYESLNGLVITVVKDD